MTENIRVFQHRGDTLQAKLDIVREAIKRAKFELWGMPGRADHILEDALEKIKEA